MHVRRPVTLPADRASHSDYVGVDPREFVHVAHPQMPGQGSGHAHLLALQHHLTELKFGQEVEEVSTILCQCIDKPAVTLSRLSQFYHVVGFQTIVEGIVGKQRPYELGLEPVESLPALQERFDGLFVLGLS